jgi:hypothetical protein
MIYLKKSLILERMEYRGALRTIIKDIINIYKTEEEGEFYLPEYFDEDEFEYSFPNLNISIELIIEQDPTIDTFKTNAAIWREDDIVTIVIKYNPNVKEKILYDLIGRLNESLAHELRHYKQKRLGTHDLDVEEPEDPLEYYTQSHEIDAQISGFDRLSKLSRRPFEDVMREWFDNNQDIHRLNDDQVEIVISKIMDEKNKN